MSAANSHGGGMDDMPVSSSTAKVELDPVPSVDIDSGRFPCSIVWTPIPCITWIFPCIGHMGIGDSTGVVHDFAGPYFVSLDDFAFGAVTRYVQFDVQDRGEWDRGIQQADAIYRRRMHNLCCDNCHSHVAVALDGMSSRRPVKHNMVQLALWVFVWGRYTTPARALCMWLPFCLLIAFVVFASLI